MGVIAPPHATTPVVITGAHRSSRFSQTQTQFSLFLREGSEYFIARWEVLITAAYAVLQRCSSLNRCDPSTVTEPRCVRWHDGHQVYDVSDRCYRRARVRRRATAGLHSSTFIARRPSVSADSEQSSSGPVPALRRQTSVESVAICLRTDRQFTSSRIKHDIALTTVARSAHFSTKTFQFDPACLGRAGRVNLIQQLLIHVSNQLRGPTDTKTSPVLCSFTIILQLLL